MSGKMENDSLRCWSGSQKGNIKGFWPKFEEIAPENSQGCFCQSKYYIFVTKAQ